MAQFLPPEETASLHARFATVCERLKKAAAASGRTPEDIRLVAISKTHPAETLAALLGGWRNGTPLFGENYAQEALEKQDRLAALLAPQECRELARPEWHFTGHVQSRKAKELVGRFSLIHTLDSEKLASAISKTVLAENLPPQAVLIQINTGREPQKSGVMPEDAEALITAVASLREIRVEGLMCLPPYSENPEASRPHFALMRTLRDTLASATGLALPHLSMGMSHDCEVAVSEGATLVRVGTDIFGRRA